MKTSWLRHFFFTFTASALNYAFFVILAKLLGEEEFAKFAPEWANLNFFMMLGTFAQYMLALRPLPHKRRYTFFWGIHSLALVIFALYFLFKLKFILLLSLLVINLIHSLLCGYLLGIGRIERLGFLNLISSALKIVFLFLIPIPSLGTESVLLVLFVSIFATHFVFSFMQNKFIDGQFETPQISTFGAAFLLAFATHFFPVQDIIWAEFFGNKIDTALISTLSIVGRTIFFLQLIFAQWLLSGQALGQNINKQFPFKKSLMLLIPVSLVFSYSSMFFLKHFLNWQNLPSFNLYLLTCLNAGFLAIHFQKIQAFILEKKIKMAFLMVSIFVLTWSLVGIGHLGVENYLICMVIAQLLILLIFHKNRSASSYYNVL